MFALQGAACGLFGPDEERRRGLILDGHENDVPDSVQVGQPFEAVIVTYGSCTRAGDTVVSMSSPDVATVEPYDIVSDDHICPSALFNFRHRVSLTFNEPGEASIVVIGYDAQWRLSELEYSVRVN